jgi:hypothetical protein
MKVKEEEEEEDRQSKDNYSWDSKGQDRPYVEGKRMSFATNTRGPIVRTHAHTHLLLVPLRLTVSVMITRQSQPLNIVRISHSGIKVEYSRV